MAFSQSVSQRLTKHLKGGTQLMIFRWTVVRAKPARVTNVRSFVRFFFVCFKKDLKVKIISPIDDAPYLLTYLPTFLPTYLITYLPSYLPTYSHTYQSGINIFASWIENLIVKFEIFRSYVTLMRDNWEVFRPSLEEKPKTLLLGDSRKNSKHSPFQFAQSITNSFYIGNNIAF